MNSSHKPNLYLILAGAALIFSLVSISCNLPAGLQERFLSSKGDLTPTPLPTNTPQPLPPAIVETDPPPGSSVGLESSITIYFNQPMDQKSVEESLAISPGLNGTYTWQDGSTLTFTPQDSFSPATRISILLETTAAASNGLLLTAPIELSYYTPDWLKASTFLPVQGSVEIDPASAIVVAFNQAVVSLGSADQDEIPGFNLTPSVPGEGTWINTSTYQFMPNSGLAGGVTYRVDLAPDLISTAGSKISPDTIKSWTFSTSYPRILSWEPADGNLGVPLDTSIILNFNQAMDPESAAEHFMLMDPLGQPVQGTLEWSDDFTEASFIPDDLLARFSNYSAILPGEVLSAGGTPIQLDTNWGFQTTGEFAFLGTPAGQNYTTSIYEGITLYFNNPVDLETVIENITILPEVTNLYPSLIGSGNVINLYGDLEPLTNYRVIINQNLADEWGGQLGTPRALNITTEPLPPNLVLTQGTSVLYITGSENAIPAQATNLYQVSINIGTIPEETFPQFFGSEYYLTLEDYYPPDVKYWTKNFNVPGDDSYTVNLPLNQAGSKLAPGLYRYQIYSQELPYNPAPFLLAVSDNHLTMKTSPENILIWAVNLATGAPLENTDIAIYNDGGEVLYRGDTNQDGIFQVDLPRPLDLYDSVFYAVTGEPGSESFGITASNWAFGTEPYNFGIQSNYGMPVPLTHIYTDRPIYRPGQTVFYRLVHRIRQDGGYALSTDDNIELTIFQSGGKSKDVVLPLSDFGTAHGEFKLSSSAEPGYYRLETEYGMVLFQVAEYRKPEINLALSLEKRDLIIGEEWQGTANARYYFDAPAKEIDLSWTLRAVPTPFYLPGYQVGVLDQNWFSYPGYAPFSWGSLVASGEGATDADGLWTNSDQLTKIDIYENEIVLPSTYILSVTTQDESGFQVSNETNMLVHPSDFYIGVNPSTWIAEADQPVEFEILTVDWDKSPDGVHQLKAEFSRITWNYEVGAIGQIDYTRDQELIAEESFSTDMNGEAVFSFTPPSPGTYQVDVFENGARTEVTLWVGGPGTTAWPTQSNQKINLISDKNAYQPGDSATIFIPNPFPGGAKALITIERHKVIDYQTISIESSGETILLPLDDDDAPNIYVSVILLGKDSDGRSDFRQGYVNLLVEPINQLLNVEVVSEPERLGPGEQVEFNIRVTDYEGKPVVGELSLAVVDLAVLALADPNSPEISEAFYGVQPLAVRLGFPLGVHAGRIVWVPGGLGGGGDAAAFVREQFEDTGYWQADIVTDDNGEAQISFTLPDNLTTWQADVLGVTSNSEVGQGSTQVITSKQLLVRPVTPRFLVAGDHLALAAIVHNNEDSPHSVEVTLQYSGILLDQPDTSTQVVEIEAHSSVRVEWWGTVEDTDKADLLFMADAGSIRDDVKPYQGSIPVYRYTAPVVFGTSGILDSGGNRLEIVTLPKSYDPDAGSLDIELSPSLAAVLFTALDAMEDDPRFSNDALMSHFLPNVITYHTVQTLELDYPRLEEKLDTIIPESLDALAARQNEDGGWGWWDGGASNVEISSYILFGLVKAQQSGAFVDDSMIQGARGYLLATLPAVEMLTAGWQYDQLAFRYFALAESGIDVSNGMVALVPLASQISPAKQALLAVALETQIPGNEYTISLLSNLAGSAVRSATGAYWENPDSCRCWFTNTLTTTAMVNYALARVEGFSDLLPESLRYLVSNLTAAGDWGSPLETSWSILALNEMLLSSSGLTTNYQYAGSVNGTELITGQVDGTAGIEAVKASIPIDTLYADDPNALVISRSEGEGRLYYKAHLLVYRPAEDIEPYGKGISISRIYSGINPENKVSFTQSGDVGDLIQVRLTLVVEHDLQYLIVEDRIPAGTEILDTRLNTSRQDIAEYQVGSPFKDGWGWWYFNQPVVYDNRIMWAANFVPAGTYQMIYTLSLTHPGEYQVLPARAWQQYFPETQAISAGDKFSVEAGR